MKRAQGGAPACFTKYDKALVLLFLLTLPLINPWVRGDGVGYYAFARSLLVEHRLDFTQDWLRANASFRMGRVDAEGRIRPEEITATGKLDNHFSIGPAMLGAPVLAAVHAGVLLYDRAGGEVAADGYSGPYRIAMAAQTPRRISCAVDRFLAGARTCGGALGFLATVGIWLGSSLPVYMTLNPSWSHAPSAFTVGLFFWYWNRTRGKRGWKQWALLGALCGLAMDAYYLNAVLVAAPLIETAAHGAEALRSPHRAARPHSKARGRGAACRG